ncbi:MAG: PDZ domain-containing protein, partial [Myxococcota bacterium]
LPSSAAAKAGLKVGDVILEVEGITVRRSEDLPRNVARHAPGSTIQLLVLRNGGRQRVSAVLERMEGEKKPSPPRKPPPARAPKVPKTPLLGLELQDSSRGPVVSGVRGSQGEIRPGDLLISVDNQPVRSTAEVAALIGKQKPGSTVLVRVRRKGQDRFVGIEVAAQNKKKKK